MNTTMKVAVKTFEGDQTIEAYPSGVKGLCVHEIPNVTWTVTHVNSGLSLCAYIPSRAIAKRVAMLLGVIVQDWTFDGGADFSTEVVKVKEVLGAIQHIWSSTGAIAAQRPRNRAQQL